MTDRLAKLRDLWAASKWDEVAAYMGPNADAFRNTWNALRTKAEAGRPGLAFGWSWPAFLFGFAWWAYRRQWAMAAVLLAMPLLIGFLLPSSGSGGAGVGIVIAMVAKSSYVQIAVARIARIKAGGGGPVEIAAAGTVSVTAGIVAGIIYALAIGAALVALFAPDT